MCIANSCAATLVLFPFDEYESEIMTIAFKKNITKTIATIHLAIYSIGYVAAVAIPHMFS